MSVLASKLRGLIASNLRNDMNPRIKRAMVDLFNAIDADLDDQNYDESAQSEEVDDAIEKLDRILASFDIPIDEDLIPLKPAVPEDSHNDNDDPNSSKFKGGDDDTD